MLDFIATLVLVLCGAVLITAARMVLHACRAFEVSMRSLVALLVGCAGAWMLVQAITEPAPHWGDLVLPVAVAIYIVDALWRRKRHQTESALPRYYREPWAGQPRE